uniref:D-glycero-beta-D-manno-heptose-7-phosphate kinase n=1 Tax=Dictyoglomus thermophilum TaxID=14 RepID=A0A7C3MQ78_DICTH
MDLKSRLIEIIKSWKGKKIAVIGDVMLDEYIIGKIERISPEAPVPILEVEEERHVLGGAANVANNIKALSGEPILFGVIGEDHGGEKIINLLSNKNIKHILITDKGRPTTLKTRLIALNQQIVRMDREKKYPINNYIQEKLISKFKKHINEIDLIILSDYAKGVLTPETTQKIINIAKSNNKEVIVDPKGKDFSKYENATLITPNEKEAKIATNMEEEWDLIKGAQKLMEIIKGKGIVITRGERGIFLLENDKFFEIPALKSEVRDVTGAGDTVISALSLSLSAGTDILSACIIANFAAGCVVRKFGTSTLSTDELIAIIPEKIEIKNNHVIF